VNHYELLGVTRAATHTELVQAWRRAASRYHPDKPGGDAVKFGEAKRAADCLLHPDSRAAYDSQGEAVSASGKIEVVTQAQVDRAMSEPFTGECMLCGGTRRVRVGARGFWSTKDCPSCARGAP
jgi:DnaJ-class molecular chaperone